MSLDRHRRPTTTRAMAACSPSTARCRSSERWPKTTKAIASATSPFAPRLSASTVHRLLATLESRRFVQFDRAASKWHVGVRSFTVGASFARRRNFSTQAIPYLRKLRDLTRETANLAVVDDEFIIVLTRMESREIMRSLTQVGGRVAMVTSGVGKAVLATYSDEDVSAVIRHHGMPRLTEKSIVRPGDLFKELEKIRKQGFALDDEEACMGLRCITTTAPSRSRRFRSRA
ncbi:DNA-binding IclR family transcriptional regulator [Bradyrhizobium barranii subsp. barranii]